MTFNSKKEVAMVSNAGPVWALQTKSQNSLTATPDISIDRCQKELGGKMTVFRGKAAAINMLDAPTQFTRASILAGENVSSQGPEAQGFTKNWPVQKMAWSISRDGTFLVRGHMEPEQLDTLTGIYVVPFGKAKADAPAKGAVNRNVCVCP